MRRAADEKLLEACVGARAREETIRRTERSRLWTHVLSAGMIVWLAIQYTWDLGSGFSRAVVLLVIAASYVEIARLSWDLRLLRFAAILERSGVRFNEEPDQERTD